MPNHDIIASGEGNTMRNVKVMGWRSNGDGVHVTKSWSVSRLFLRTQDDAMYITSGEGAHSHYDRIITWNDANGWSFKFSAGGGDAEFSTFKRTATFCTIATHGRTAKATSFATAAACRTGLCRGL